LVLLCYGKSAARFWTNSKTVARDRFAGIFLGFSSARRDKWADSVSVDKATKNKQLLPGHGGCLNCHRSASMAVYSHNETVRENVVKLSSSIEFPASMTTFIKSKMLYLCAKASAIARLLTV
jgi:hypothetical protein